MFPQSRALLSFAILAAFSLGGYLWVSHEFYTIGFPLDDAWIHQTYARNFAQSGEWAFQPGERSGGSTAPLWSSMLGLGHLLGLGPYWAAYVLGWFCLWGVGFMGYHAFQELRPGLPWGWGAIAGVLLILEWHLVWAAGSGMETLLFAALALALLARLVRLWNKRKDEMRRSDTLSWLGIGVLVGISAWMRPDGITLLGPALLVAVLVGETWAGRLRKAILIAAGFCLLFIPYLFFNRAVAGAWWPTTLFAKQAEYASLLEVPFPERMLRLAVLPLIGAGIILLPGFLNGFVDQLRRGEWGAVSGGLWALGYLGIYALRLPVTYQHGRYLIPIIPVFCIWGFAGLSSLLQNHSISRWRWVASRVWLASLAAVLLVFWVRGAQAYAWDVAVIESEMGAAARWVARNTSPDTLVATHDIGALGYFGGRKLLDLAGLISPEVIPFIADEKALEDYLNAKGASYLVTFPGWYPALSARGSPLFTTGGAFSPALGGENMTVYVWKTGIP